MAAPSRHAAALRDNTACRRCRLYGNGLRTLSIATVVAMARRSAWSSSTRRWKPNRASCRRSSTCTCRWRSSRCAASCSAACSRSSTCARAIRAGTCAPTSSIHMSLIFAVGTLITGSIWAKGSWGHWWVWSEPTLVSFLIVFLLYATYQPLRFAIEDPERQARYASVFAITAGAFVPMNFIAVRLSTAYLHPRVLGSTSNLPAPMALDVPRLAGGDGAAVRDAVQVRADRQAHPRAAARAAPAPDAATELPRRARSAARSSPHRALPGDARRRGGALARARAARASARAAAAHGRQVRRRRLHRAVRARADLRRDHGDPPEPHRARLGELLERRRERGPDGPRPTSATPASHDPERESTPA